LVLEVVPTVNSYRGSLAKASFMLVAWSQGLPSKQ